MTTRETEIEERLAKAEPCPCCHECDRRGTDLRYLLDRVKVLEGALGKARGYVPGNAMPRDPDCQCGHCVTNRAIDSALSPSNAERERYDSKCYDLAVAFLKDEPALDTEDARKHLAQEIQDTIEGWIASERIEAVRP